MLILAMFLMVFSGLDFAVAETSKTGTIELSETKLNVLVGCPETLTCTTSLSGATITWKSSRNAVATVSDSGRITGKKAGSATITATATLGETVISATCAVTVKSSMKAAYSQTHTVKNYASQYKSYRRTYGTVIGTAQDGTGGTPDLCIPGLSEADGMTPQGLAYWEEKDQILISAHDGTDAKRPGVIFVLDAKTGKLVSQFSVYNEKLTAHTGHMSGIAVSEHNLYLTCGYNRIAYVPLEQLENNDSVLVIRGRITVDALNDANASYLGFGDGCIWTGNYYYENSSSYDTPANSKYNSLILGYRISGKDSAEEWSNLSAATAPDYTIQVANSIDRIQCAFVDGGKLYINRSYGRASKSSLMIGAVKLKKTVTVYRIGMIEYTTLPMGEGICIHDGSLYSLNESAAYTFMNGDGNGNSKHPSDVIWKTPLSFGLISRLKSLFE